MTHPHVATYSSDSAGLTRKQLLLRAGAGGLALTSLPALLAACGDDNKSATGGTSSAEIGTLTWAISAPIRALDVKQSYDFTTPSVLSNLLEGLLVINEGVLEPALAKSWEQPNLKTYVYELRDDVKFWDGSPLTPEDVVFSLNRAREKDSLVAFMFATVSTIRKTGPHQVTVKLKAADPLFQYVVAHHAGKIVNKKFAESKGKDLGTPEALTMGTGPFKAEQFIPDQSVTLIRNDEYWGEKPAVRKLVIKFITDESTRLLAMRSGEVDGAFSVPVEQSRQWESIRGAKLHSVTSLWSCFLQLNVEGVPWEDIEVRRAISHSVDRQGLVNSVLRGHGRPATAVVPPEHWTALLPIEDVKEIYAKLPTYDFDLDAAKAALAKSSVPSGFKAVARYPDHLPRMGKMFLNLSENLKKIGVDLEVVQQTEQAWLADIFAHKNLGIRSDIYFPDFPDPLNYPSLLLPSASAAPNGLNLANFRNDRVDQLLEDQGKTLDKADRAKGLEEILRIMADELPYVPVWWEESLLALKEQYTIEGLGPFVYFQPWAARIRSAA